MKLRLVLFVIGQLVAGFALAQGVHRLIVYPLAVILIIALVVIPPFSVKLKGLNFKKIKP